MASIYKRRTPEEILADIRRMSRGKHRIYLGAAPGVGKTYTMLEDAHLAKRQGIDVVVGVVDAHGRAETQALLEGLEAMPLKPATYKGVPVQELDVEAVRERAPDVVLVDELAHTNADGMPHAKRWEDVQELLDAGISVWSTLNIQHLESLNDTVRQIVGVRVRETVPDSVVREADELRLVDLPPEALIERLKQGKVYAGRTADRALQHFFRAGNLTALRELALRIVADETDDRLERYMDSHDIEGPWPVQDRIMVAITPSPNGARLIRRGYRIARRLKAEFYVVIVRPPEGSFSARDEVSLATNLALARQFGAKTVELRSANVARALVDFAKEHHITQIVMGESLRTPWQEFTRGSVINQVLRQTSNIDILVVGKEWDRGEA
ncbi:Osmosensitive K+ channel histidine kinase KdpD [Candidatus Hydrogenisulfobacillus filiaventi]|uniref:Osmosensitive K+ channel histidine kinase KdpD n=1 Tax=Candidatus Hydrogenisulfobacillus filiaventi TaxID=2707344 RepID=A0A6F8ZGN2_9FIRM|nr:universal stress protein [Bacillota bacterium]CAB1128752.1 Osmosensitive K+ channel histidine kinase KdpD [Candidatus Hydrogenisulfobacillus filiaventi]